jgi:uncharacterized Zn finger protein (UPF0148 family)
MKKILSNSYFKITNFLISNRFKLIVFIFTTSSILLYFCDPVLARAGGGGGYSGGSSGGGFSGGGSSGGGGGLFILIYFLMRYPYIGIPALIIFLFFAYHGSKGAKSTYMTRTIKNGYTNQLQNNLADTINNIKTRDENFSVEVLTDRIKTGFMKIQNAWAAQDVKPVRYIMSDGVYERFSIQLGIQKNSKIINKMDNIEFIMAQVVAAETDHYFDTVHLMVTASASDYYINSDTGKMVYGRTSSEVFTEYWSFLRRPGVKTLEKDGLFEGRCPNCGVPLDIGDSVICPSCDAIVNSGEYDWVLSEITQPSEWKIKPPESIAGINEIMEKDPAFNIQHIEDKTSVIFYRNIASEFYSDKKYISKLALSDFTEKHLSEYQTDKHGKSSYYADAAIGCVEVIEITVAQKDNDYDKDNDYTKDRIRVKVKWAGHPENAKIPSLIPPAYEENRIYTQEYILVRKSDVETSTKNTLSSTHCPNCGAPETAATLNECEYCGAILNDGSRDWVLEEVTYFKGYTQHSSPYQALEHTPFQDNTQFLSKFDNETIMGCTVAVMLIDGNIDEKENKLLQKMAVNRGITPVKLDSIVTSIKEHGLHIPNPKSRDEAQEFLKCMVRMCLADGKVTSQEKQLIKQLVSRMNYTDIDIDQMIKKERNSLYKAAKQVNAK